jgi:Flp pilus assembly protein TadG
MDRKGSPAPDRRVSRRRQMTGRRGSVLVLAALLMVVVFACAALAVDLGYVALSKTQLQSAADASALAAALELPPGLGADSTSKFPAVLLAARDAAADVASAHRNADRTETYLDGDRDVEFGQCTWSVAEHRWVTEWDKPPYNLVGVTICRNQSDSESSARGDGPVPTFIAPVLGRNGIAVAVTASAVLFPGVGIRVVPGSGETAPVLPLTVDLESWTSLIDGAGPDDYSVDTDTNSVSSGGDGLSELNVYPNTNPYLPSGNRGTVNIGSTSNGNGNLNRQILNGITEDDLNGLGIQLRTDAGPFELYGNPGVSASLSRSLTAIIGQPRLMPVFVSYTGSGGEALYSIVKFVPITIVYVQLDGEAKAVVVQPRWFSSPQVIHSKTPQPIAADTYFTPPRLIE